MARPLFHNRAVTGPLIALATFVAIGILQWPLPLVLAVIVPVSIVAAHGAAVNSGGGHGTLLTLAGFFGVLSLFAIGGGNSAIPEMHRFAVDVQHWLSDRQFADTFALAQLTPGPNLIIVALIGYHVAGIAGGAGRDGFDVRTARRVRFLRRRRVRKVQGQGLAYGAEPRAGAGDDRSHRRERGCDRFDGGL